MFGLLQNFEQAAGRFSPIVLIVPGIAIVLAGLFVWLGGLGFRRVLAGVAGAVTGGACGLFVIRRNIPSAVLLASVMTAVAVIFERIFFIVLTATLTVVASFAILAWPYLGNPQQLAATSQSRVSIQRPALSTHETIEVVKAYFVNINYELKKVYSRMPLHNWVIIAALTATFFFIGFYSWRLVASLSCATVGAMLVFVGMALLLLYKGSAPISNICSRASFYGSIFIAMTVAGTIGQLLLCRRVKKHSKKRKETNEEKEESNGTRRGWRTI